MICNLCFYGAVRTLDKTSDSIKKYVINPLSKQYTIKIFATVWEDDDESPYSNFENVKIKKINRPKRFSKIKNEVLETFMNIYHNATPDYLRNLYYALYSLKNVTNMVSKKINSDDITIFLRPDSKFYSEIPLEKVKSSVNQVITPLWDNWYFHPEYIAGKSRTSDEGSNDRLIICSNEETAKIVGLRYDMIDEYANKKKGINNSPIIQPEGFFEWILKKNNIKNIKVDICFTLLRENGDELGDCIVHKDPFWKNKKTKRKIPK